jgi:DNA-binding beta-propeller fold protein YncE
MDRKRRFSWVMVPLLVAGLLVVGHGNALAATGDLTQLPDPHECVADTAADGCAVARRMNESKRVTVSPDAKNVYMASQNGGVVIFDRVVTSAPYGRLSQKAGADGCIQAASTTEACAVEPSASFSAPQAVAISPDGANAYIGAGPGILVYDRNVSGGTSHGALIPKAGSAHCISTSGPGNGCVQGTNVQALDGLAVSPDGRSVYAVAFGSNRMFAFDRNTTAGPSLGSLSLKPGDRGCFKPLPTETNICQGVVGMIGATDVVVSPDSRSVYMADFWSNGMMVFDRDTSGGASDGDLTQKSGVLGCVTAGGSGGACTTGRALFGANMVAISFDGRSVYVSGPDDHAIAIFTRTVSAGTTNGEVNQSATTAGCISQGGAGTCVTGLALSSPIGIAVSPDDGNVYVASAGSNALAVLDRQTSGATVGTLSQSTGPDGCISKDGSAGACGTASTLSGPRGVAVSPDHETVYVTALDTKSVTSFARQAALPTVSIGDATAVENNSNTFFNLRLSRMTSTDVLLDVSSTDGTAQKGIDYRDPAVTGVTIPMGTLSSNLPVGMFDDSLDEVDETFTVTIGNASGAILADADGLGTILDNDDPPSISVADVTKAEGDSGTSNLKFKLLLSVPSGKTIDVDYATLDGTGTKPAIAPKDYTATAGTATFAPGTMKVVVKVPIKGDTKKEPAESFFLNLSNNVNGSLPDAQATGKITNDD